MIEIGMGILAGCIMLLYGFHLKLSKEIEFLKSCLDDDAEGAAFIDEEIEKLNDEIQGLKCDVECIHNDVVTLKKPKTKKTTTAKGKKK